MAETDSTDGGQKIFIDEDWKARVQREKEEAAQQATESPEPESPNGLPEQVDFSTLTSMFAMQAMMALGAMAQETDQEIIVDLDAAKLYIDLLMVLREKTQGNLTPEEQGQLTAILSDLQRGFMVRSQQLQEASLREMGMNPPNLGM